MPIKYSGNQWLHGNDPINPDSGNLTIEAILSLEGNGDNPTIFCQPCSEKWEKPFVAYRIGFEGNSGKPQFQFLIEGDDEPTSIVAPNPEKLNGFTHIAGTFDGKVGILYVNGKEVEGGRVYKTGSIAKSNQPFVIGTRSKTDPGNYLVASVYEIRIMNCIRTPQQIEFWKDKEMPAPKSVKVWDEDFVGPRPAYKPGELLGLWSAW